MPQDEDGLPAPSKEKGTWRTWLWVTIATWEHVRRPQVSHCLFAVCVLAWAMQVRAGFYMLPVQRAGCELLYGWYAECLCPFQLSSKQTRQCFIKLSVHGHPGPPLQILHSKKTKKRSVSYSELSIPGLCSCWGLSPAIQRTDAAVKGAKALPVFWRGFSGHLPSQFIPLS